MYTYTNGTEDDGKHLLLHWARPVWTYFKIFSYVYLHTHTYTHTYTRNNNQTLIQFYCFHIIIIITIKKVYFWERDREICVHICTYTRKVHCTHVYGCCYKFFLVFPCSFNTLTHILHELCCVYFSYRLPIANIETFPSPLSFLYFLYSTRMYVKIVQYTQAI